METKENNESQDNAGKKKQGNRVDPGGLFNDPKIQEVIKHLLSGGGAVLVNYLFSIMPINGKIEELTEKNRILEAQIADIKEKFTELIDQLNEKFGALKENDALNGNCEYFQIPAKAENKERNRINGHERR